jgi:hypothetical protein
MRLSASDVCTIRTVRPERPLFEIQRTSPADCAALPLPVGARASCQRIRSLPDRGSSSVSPTALAKNRNRGRVRMAHAPPEPWSPACTGVVTQEVVLCP